MVAPRAQRIHEGLKAALRRLSTSEDANALGVGGVRILVDLGGLRANAVPSSSIARALLTSGVAASRELQSERRVGGTNGGVTLGA